MMARRPAGQLIKPCSTAPANCVGKESLVATKNACFAHFNDQMLACQNVFRHLAVPCSNGQSCGVFDIADYALLDGLAVVNEPLVAGIGPRFVRNCGEGCNRRAAEKH